MCGECLCDSCELNIAEVSYSLECHIACSVNCRPDYIPTRECEKYIPFKFETPNPY